MLFFRWAKIFVRHRIDGLETIDLTGFLGKGVRHRIDGLEIIATP